MSALQNPTKINRLWKKINDRFGPEEEEDEKRLSGRAKDAAKQRKKVNKGLHVLKILSKGGLKSPAKIKKFESNRAKLLKGMKKYCKLLKGSKIEGLQDQTKYRKSVMQLTVVIEALSPTQVTDEEGDEDISVLLGIQTDKVESSLDDPALDAEDNEEFDEVEEEGEETTPSTETKLTPSAPDLAAAFKQRLQTLTPAYQQALKAGASNKGALEQAMKLALDAVKNQNFQQALTQLDKLQTELNKASGSGGVVPPAPPPPPVDLSAAFKTRLQSLTPGYQQALKAGSANKGALEQAMKLALDAAKKQDFQQALTQLDKLQAELRKTGAEEEAGEAEQEEATPTTHMATWNKTKDRVDAQINKLCDYLRKTRQEALVEAAGKLAATMDMFKVDLTASLMSMDRANLEQRKKLFPKVSQVIANYKQSLQADKLLAAAEDNPYVPVDARKPLLATLDQIQKNLEAQVRA